MKKTFLSLSALLCACGSDPATPDASLVDATPNDATADATADGAPSRCTVPAPRLGDGTEARQLAESPARCGQSPHRWLSDARLGTPTGVGMQTTFAASVLRGLAAAANINLPVTIQYDVAVDQVSYTTQDRGQLLDATTLVAYPRNLSERRDFEVLLVLHGTTGFNDTCAPSGTADARMLAAAFASVGYVVIAPDYIGLRAFGGQTGFLHPYLLGQPVAIASLDALRAGVRHVAGQATEACARTRYVTIGGSEGGHAALWVDRIGGYYAPEFEAMGTVATVPPADMEAETNRALRMDVQASASVMAFYAAAAPWHGLSSRLSEVYRAPWDMNLPNILATQCSPDDSVRGASRTTVFAQRLLDAAATTEGVRSYAPWGCLVTENGLTTTSTPRATSTRPGYGILWVLGENDQLVNTPIERVSFATLCRQGYRMQYLECAGAAHTRATTWALPEILEFARARFDERPLDAATTCQVAAPVRCRATPAMM